MPNFVTNEIKAPRQVLETLINADGKIDFNRIIPFEGEFPWDGVYGLAETAAESVLRLPLHSEPMIASLQRANRQQVDIGNLDEVCFEQFVQMLRNHRKTGFLHEMDFARVRWGTKWNACDQKIELDAGMIRFDTAWNFPEPVLLKLSSLHPEAMIDVRYADEDIGSNCGSMRFHGGAVAGRDVASRWSEMTEADQKKWQAFAYEVTGSEPEDE